MSPVTAGRHRYVERRDTDAEVVLTYRDTEVARWPLEPCAGTVGHLGVVDRLARSQLAAQRIGCAVHVHNPCRDLAALLEWSGLSEVVRANRLGVETGRKPETGEEPGVEEVVVPDDPGV